MIGINVTADEEFFDRLDGYSERFKKTIVNRLNRFADVVAEKVRQNLSGKVVQVRSGKLLESLDITYATMENFNAQVYMADAPFYAELLEFGSPSAGGTYIIQANKAKVLKFFWEKRGIMFRGKRVQHPYQRRMSFLYSALTGLDGEFPNRIAAGLIEESF